MPFERQRNKKHVDLVGTRVNKLTVIAPAEDYVNPKGQRYLQWLCRCDCGKTVIKRGTAIVNGKAKSCGCARKSSLKDRNVRDMTGQHFGRWTVLSRAGSNKFRAALWNCKCACGNTGVVSGATLRRGDSLSCGCLKMEHLIIDRNLTGMKFGLLTVIDRAPDEIMYGRNNKMWNCKCACGNICVKRESDLLGSSVRSCGCIGRSGNERFFHDLLDECGISFSTEKTYPDLVGETGKPLRYDFYLHICGGVLIELHGMQHYSQVDFFQYDFQKEKAYDVLKENYAQSHGIFFFKVDCSDRPSKIQLANRLHQILTELQYSDVDVSVLTYNTFFPNDVLAKPDLPRFSGSRRSISKYARYYQFDVVYKRELALWYENPQYRDSTLREWLYANRETYLGKSREKLTSQEILSGFTISGILRGFTTFDTKLMDQILSKYAISGLYDPCAGWGERMLLSYIRNIPYYGVDINAELKSGYDLMIQEFSMKHQCFIVADSANMIMPAQYDTVITCPPYYNLERYSDQGCENLSYKDFLSWWDKVVANCSNAKLFCFQINQKYKACMQQIVEQHGYCLKEELLFGYAKSSHFMKSSGQDIKKEYESMLVFCKE